MAENEFFFFVLKISHSCQILKKETHQRESLSDNFVLINALTTKPVWEMM